MEERHLYGYGKEMKEKGDIAIIGGGITALSIAWLAALQGKRVIIAWQKRIGAATPAAAGMLCPTMETDSARTPLLDLALKSCHMYPEWIGALQKTTGIDCGYRDGGSLLLALSHDHVADLKQMQLFQQSMGLESRWLNRREVQSMEACLSTRQVGGLYAAQESSVNPMALQAALSAAVRQSSNIQAIEADGLALMVSDRAVEGLIARSGSGEERLPARDCIVADGAWSGVHPLLGWLPLRPVKGQCLRLQGSPLLQRVVRTPDVYLVPRDNGELYLGATVEEEGFKEGMTAGGMLDLLYHGWQALPGIYELEVVATAFGYRPALRDNQPAIGRTDIQGLYLSVGQYRHGIMLAPGGAEWLLRVMENGDMVNPLTPLRFVV
jgi:glycine oxidase